MRFKIVHAIFLLLFFFSDALAQDRYGAHQPYSSYWFVDELLEWDQLSDPHARFNISHTPLAERFVDPGTQINPELSSEPSITSLVASHTTSSHPSQGFRSVEHYAFPYWQYIDYFVQWGGSSAEGIIVTPAVPWIDAAHRNGVKILGTVFFPPLVYGGKKEWVLELLQKDPNGNFPVADKLLEVADHYQFDGWFINQETDGLSEEEARKMEGFLTYYQQKSEGRFQMMWYDAMIKDGRVIWQEELNHHNEMYFQNGDQRVSDIMFLDFGWSATQLEDSHQRALELGRSPWQLFSGIDVQQRGYRSYVRWKNLYQNGKPHATSIGLYWPNSTFDLATDKQPETVYLEEQKFWNGTVISKKDDKIGKREWKGFSNYFPARSVIHELPFVTHFNYGLGKFYNEKGQRLSENEWHNLSNQDILPTWQWIVDTTYLAVTFDFTESYTGGSSLKIDFQKAGQELYIPLYKTSLPLNGNEKFEVTAKGTVTLKLSLDFSDGTTEDYPITLGQEWKITSGGIGKPSGGKLVRAGIKVSGESGDMAYIGKLSITSGRKTGISRPKVSIESFNNGSEAEMYLHIQGAEGAAYHSIYRLAPDGSKIWLGQTGSAHYYVPEVEKGPDRRYTIIYVISTARDGSRSKPAIQKLYWR